MPEGESVRKEREEGMRGDSNGERESASESEREREEGGEREIDIRR